MVIVQLRELSSTALHALFEIDGVWVGAHGRFDRMTATTHRVSGHAGRLYCYAPVTSCLLLSWCSLG